MNVAPETSLCLRSWNKPQALNNLHGEDKHVAKKTASGDWNNGLLFYGGNAQRGATVAGTGAASDQFETARRE